MSNGALQNVLLLPHLVVGLQLVITSVAASMKKKKKERKQWPSAASYLHGLANISWSSSTSFLAVFKSSLMCVETNTRTDVGLG